MHCCFCQARQHNRKPHLSKWPLSTLIIKWTSSNHNLPWTKFPASLSIWSHGSQYPCTYNEYWPISPSSFALQSSIYFSSSLFMPFFFNTWMHRHGKCPYKYCIRFLLFFICSRVSITVSMTKCWNSAIFSTSPSAFAFNNVSMTKLFIKNPFSLCSFKKYARV